MTSRDSAPATYSVTYEPGANGTGAQQTVTKTKNVSLTLEGAIFTRTGYTQTGWSTSDGGAKAYNLSSSYTDNAAKTLYPFWTPITYTVSYNYNGGTKGAKNPSSGTYGEWFYVDAPTKAGFMFGGWTVTSGLDTTTACWGLPASSAWWLTSSSTLCVNGASGSVFFKNLRPTNGSVTITANWQQYSEMAVYRMLSPYSGEYLYSGVEVEIEAMVAAGWIREGVVFWALSQPYGTAIPLYRLISPFTGLHLYSSNELEKDILVANYGWVYEGVAFYVDASADGELADSQPIHRAASITGHHILTSNEIERKALEDYPEWTVEGIAFWASSPTRAVSLVNAIDDSEYVFEAAYNEPLPDIVPPSQPGLAFGGYLLDCELDDGDGEAERLEEMVYDASGHTTWDCFGDMTLHAVWEEAEP